VVLFSAPIRMVPSTSTDRLPVLPFARRLTPGSGWLGPGRRCRSTKWCWNASLLPESGDTTDWAEQFATGGVLVGLGPVLPGIQAAESWRAARTGLRLTSPELTVVRADELGGLIVLAERLRPEDIALSPDVLALDRIAAEPGGEDLLGILRAYCATDSVRKAAALVYRHHSTIATTSSTRRPSSASHWTIRPAASA
jgi:hypothetical protein